MESQKTANSQRSINTARDTILLNSDYITDYRVMMTKTAGYWHINRHKN